MEHEIGTHINLEVVEGCNCEDCFFCNNRTGACECPYECRSLYRTDHKDVIYKEIKED